MTSISVTILLLLGFLHAASAQTPGIPLSSNKKKIDQKAEVPEGLSPDKVDAYLAVLSDEQARQVLAKQLKEQTAGNSRPGFSDDVMVDEDATDKLFHRLTLGACLMVDQIASFFSADAENESIVNWPVLFNRMSGGRGAGHILLTLLIGFGMIACGIVVERLVLRQTANLQDQILSSVTLGRLQRIGRFISRLLLELAGLGAYILATFILLILFFRQEEADYWIVSEI